MARFLSFCVVFAMTGLFAYAQDQSPDMTGATLLQDNFISYPPGDFFSVVGAHAEYHYLPETEPKGPWSVAAYRSETGSQLAWKVYTHDGVRVMAQTYRNKRKETHPMLCAGDLLWRDYEMHVRFAPELDTGRAGFCFRYLNNRCYYFLGVDGPRVQLLRVRHATGLRTPDELVLSDEPFVWTPGQYLNAHISLHGNKIRAELDGRVILEATDDSFPQGGVALIADIPTLFSSVTITTSKEELQRIDVAMQARARDEQDLQARNPRPVVWRKMKLGDFAVGRNLRFGDLNGDKEIDILLGQVVHHGPKDRNSELSCLTAVDTDGRMLWQVGEPDPWKSSLTNDVAFQIHDLDGDGRNEVIYCMHQEIIVADGAAGKTLFKIPAPLMPENTASPYNKSPRILGDSLFFCDTRGLGWDADLIIKDRYQSFWVLDNQLNLLWHSQCNTGHYPFAGDIDGDGKDEIAMGYSLFDHDGTLLWSLDDTLTDHADGTAIVNMRPETDVEPVIFCAASDEGAFTADLRGNILKHHYIGHVQNPAIADLRPDLPGLEAVTVNFWGNQGIIHFFDADGLIYHSFEPFHHGSMCLPINWIGDGIEYVMLSANAVTGGLFDGWGRRAVTLPDDGHPDMCYAVLDITGDCRDEIVVWNPHELWIYTQSDNPRSGRLYAPRRNPLYNYSNYQATVSLPGWSE